MTKNRVGLPIGDLYLKLVCSRGHAEHEVEWITGAIDDNGRLHMFAHHFDWTQAGTQHFSGPNAWEEWRDFAAKNPAPNYLDARDPKRSVPDQRMFRENESFTWRIFCKSCRLDIQLPNPVIAAIFRQAQLDNRHKIDISAPDEVAVRCFPELPKKKLAMTRRWIDHLRLATNCEHCDTPVS